VEKIRLIRDLNLNELEVYRLRFGFYGDIITYMIFVDMKRKSDLNDFPYLKGVEDENDFGRSNFVKVLFLIKKKWIQ
jgi:hypothetical protein